MGSIIKFQLQKTIASTPQEIPKKRKKSVDTSMGHFVSDKIGFDRTIFPVW
jgi:hypothetical protein